MELGKEIFKGKHTFVCGMTQNGKTYFTVKKLQESKMPVLFFNPQCEKVKGFIKADWNTNPQMVLKALKAGKKINYIPNHEDGITAKEFSFLTGFLFGKFPKEKPLIFAIDETHIMSQYKESKQALIKIANRGLTMGLNAVFISQRPADVPYTIYTQCDQHFIFKVGMEKEYFRRKGVDYNDLVERIERKGKYSYCVFDNVSLKGAYKE